MIVTYITTSWVVSLILFSTLSFAFELGITNIHGFCMFNTESILFKAIVGVLCISGTLSLGVEFSFSILSAIYIKKHTVEGNSDIKKAVAKVLAYLTVTSVISSTINIAATAIPPVRKAYHLDDVISFLVISYAIVVITIIPNTAIPIIAIALLKPMHTAIKTRCATTQGTNTNTEP